MNTCLRHGAPWFLVLALALIFAGIGTVGAQSARTGALDPAAWGVYAKLVDSSWLHEEYQRPRRWQWDNGKIIEEFPEWGVSTGRATIEPGSELGKLVYTQRADGIDHQWHGEVAQDGSVLWIKKSILKQPFRVRLEGTDRMAKEWVKLRGDEVVPTRHVEMFTAMTPSAVAKFFSEKSAPRDQAPSADELEATAAALLEKARKQRADDGERVAGNPRPQFVDALQSAPQAGSDSLHHQQSLDPNVWGVYAKLAASDLVHRQNALPSIRYRMYEGTLIRESTCAASNSAVDTFVADAGSGKLTRTTSRQGNAWTWQGSVQPDGGILFLPEKGDGDPYWVVPVGKDGVIAQWKQAIRKGNTYTQGAHVQYGVESKAFSQFGPIADFVGKCLYHDESKTLLTILWGENFKLYAVKPDADGEFRDTEFLLEGYNDDIISMWYLFDDPFKGSVTNAKQVSFSQKAGFFTMTTAQHHTFTADSDGALVWHAKVGKELDQTKRFRVLDNSAEVSSAYSRSVALAQQTKVEIAAWEEERQRAESQERREKNQRSQAFWGNVAGALQVTGAIIDEHSAQTQASLDATVARAAAQEVAQRQHQAGVQARAEAQRQAEATQYTRDNASSAGLDAQNQANLARMRQSLQQARQQGLDPALIASMQEAVDGVEESLRDDGGDPGNALAQQQEDDRQRRQQEQQQAEQQRQADARERQLLAQQERERAAQARREQAEQAKQKQQQALRDHLAAEQRGIRLRTLTCPGGGSNYFVTGNRPSISPRVVQCISVRFEARCPATRPGQGHVDVAGNFVGGNSCVGDTRKIPALSCLAEQVVVDVLDVTTCN